MTKSQTISKSQISKLLIGISLGFGFWVLGFSQPAAAALVPCGGLDCTFKDLGQLLINIYDYLLGLAGLVAILFVVYGGFQMVYGWTTEQPEGAYKEGQLTVRRALWGLILIATAYLVVNTILTVLFGASELNTFFADLFKK